MWVTSSLATVLTPAAVALGNFDGIHRGHRQVIWPILHSALAPAVSLPPFSTVVTFHPHPQEFFSGQARQLLTPLNEKVVQLKQMGVQQLVLLPFDQELANLSPEEFVKQVLIHNLKATRVSVGLDFCFGRQRAGTAQDLQAIGASHGVEVTIAPLEILSGERISSSAIRKALQQGDLQLANHLLGRPYEFVGKVVKGQQLGRKLGFPTANLNLSPNKFLPKQGVYAVRVSIYTPDDLEKQLYPRTRVLGVMNLGTRPTIEGTQQTVEVHLFDWIEDLYGKVLLVHLENFLRPEQKFTSLDDLKAQIQQDCESARTILAAGSMTDPEL